MAIYEDKGLLQKELLEEIGVESPSDEHRQAAAEPEPS